MAIIIFAIIAASTAAMFTQYMNSSRFSRELTTGAFIASNLLERYVMGADFSNLSNVCNDIPSEIEYEGTRYVIRCENVKHGENLIQVFLSLAWDRYRHLVNTSVYRFNK